MATISVHRWKRTVQIDKPSDGKLERNSKNSNYMRKELHGQSCTEIKDNTKYD